MKRLIKVGKSRQFHKDENGMMVVECTLCLTLFIVVVLTIVNLTNVFMVHNKVQFAINSAAHELANYSYIYEATGLRATEKNAISGHNQISTIISETSDVFNLLGGLKKEGTSIVDNALNMNDTEDFDALKSQMSEFATNYEHTTDRAKILGSDIRILCSNKSTLILGVLHCFLDGVVESVKKAGGVAAAQTLTYDYLGEDPDNYLKSMGVVNGYADLNFEGSSLFLDSNQCMVDIVVQYDIDLPLIQMLIPDAKIHMVQRACVPAWLDGDGGKIN